MSNKVLTRALFSVWMMIITVLGIVPQSNEGIVVSSNVTVSGMEKHIVGYFVASLLWYYAYKRDSILFFLISGLLIFLYSVALEIVQIYLPYRAFNMYDIVANASGILFFILILIIYFQIIKRNNNRKLTNTA